MDIGKTWTRPFSKTQIYKDWSGELAVLDPCPCLGHGTEEAKLTFILVARLSHFPGAEFEDKALGECRRN